MGITKQLEQNSTKKDLAKMVLTNWDTIKMDSTKMDTTKTVLIKMALT